MLGMIFKSKKTDKKKEEEEKEVEQLLGEYVNKPKNLGGLGIMLRKYHDYGRNYYAIEVWDKSKLAEIGVFGESEMFNTRRWGDSRFSDYEVRRFLDDIEAWGKVGYRFYGDKREFYRVITEEIEGYYENIFEKNYKEVQYRKYLKKLADDELTEMRLSHEVDHGIKFENNAQFKQWYIQGVNRGYGTHFTEFEEAQTFQRMKNIENIRGGKPAKGGKPTHLSGKEKEMIEQVLKAGFRAMSKKFHPDMSSGSESKMKELNVLKEKVEAKGLL